MYNIGSKSTLTPYIRFYNLTIGLTSSIDLSVTIRSAINDVLFFIEEFSEGVEALPTLSPVVNNRALVLGEPVPSLSEWPGSIECAGPPVGVFSVAGCSFCCGA